MDGLLAQAQPQPPAANTPAGPQSPMVDTATADAVASEKMDKFKRLVLGGKAILYKEPASSNFLKFLDPNNLPQSIGEIIAVVMAGLIDKGKQQAAPPDLILPAGVALVGDLLAYAGEAFDVEVTEDLTKEAINAFLGAMQREATKATGGQPGTPTAGTPAPTQQPQPQPMGV